MPSGEHLVIVGASARAAAFSALRAGLKPWCADLFGDADLRQVCPVRTIDRSRYPEGFLQIAAEAPPGPCLYTGGIENHPTLVQALARQRRLWGNEAETLRQVRSPQRLFALLRSRRLPCLEIRTDPDGLPLDGGWLSKPYRGSGGRGISPWRGQEWHDSYFQEKASGSPLATVYLANRDTAQLLGVTRQLVGCDWLHAGPFQYCGSIGPLVVSKSLATALTAIGSAIASGLHLRGLFGIDFIVQDDYPWLVEVNPRYTASIEVLEHALGIPFLELHRRVFDPASPALATAIPASRLSAKAILFTPCPLTLPAHGPWQDAPARPLVNQLPAFADIPSPGQFIRPRMPVLTFLATGDTEADCVALLRASAADLDRRLGIA
jgi:predicted ATP-grasp superfamily ATP-dependent carboligase